MKSFLLYQDLIHIMYKLIFTALFAPMFRVHLCDVKNRIVTDVVKDIYDESTLALWQVITANADATPSTFVDREGGMSLMF